MAQTIKVERTLFKLGDIELYGYMKPDGSYCLNQTQVCECVDKDKRSMRDFLASKSPYALPHKHLSGGKSKGTKLNKLKVEGESSQRATEVPLGLAFAFWMKESQVNNEKAASLVFACGLESLERRLDAAFGKKRTEQERNELLASRLLTKESFRPLTDELKRHGFTEPWQYGTYIKAFQSSLGFENGTRDELDTMTLMKLNACQHELKILMQTGNKPWQALRIWKQLKQK